LLKGSEQIPAEEQQSTVTFSKELAIAATGVGLAALAGVWTWRALRRWRRKDPAELERLRRLAVNACGRIIAGKVLDLAEPLPDGAPGPILLYEYEVAGVTYEAAQDVNALPEIAAAAPFLPGQTTSVKFDPRHPTNSILACEEWCGIPDLESRRNPRRQGAEDLPDPLERE
jgi:hypothetical protein